MLGLNYENINYVMSQILKLSCVSFSYVNISYVLAILWNDCASLQIIIIRSCSVRNHVKLIHVVNSRRGFSKGTVLCGGYWLWAWQISWGLQTCIAERSKVPNG